MEAYLCSFHTSLIVKMPCEQAFNTSMLVDEGAIVIVEKEGDSLVLHGAGFIVNKRSWEPVEVTVSILGAMDVKVATQNPNMEPVKIPKQGEYVVLVGVGRDIIVKKLRMSSVQEVLIAQKEIIERTTSLLTLIFVDAKLLGVTAYTGRHYILCVNIAEAVGDKKAEAVIRSLLDGFAIAEYIHQQRIVNAVKKKIQEMVGNN